jgi:hypothetical protein
MRRFVVKAPIHLSSSVLVLGLASLVAIASAGCASTRGPQDSSLMRPYNERFVAVGPSQMDPTGRAIEPAKDHSREARSSWH